MVDPDLAKRIVTAARKSREWQARRDRLILEALEAGATQREVAKLANLTQPAISHLHTRQKQSQHPTK